MSYKITEKQKGLLRWLVQKVRSNELPDEFHIIWEIGGRGYEFLSYKGDKNELPDISQIALDALSEDEFLICRPQYQISKVDGQYETVRNCVLTGKAFEAVDTNFEVQPVPVQQINIGAVIQSMSGGNIQTIGLAHATVEGKSS